MGQMNGQKPTGNDELALLNETRDITRAVETLEQKNIPTIRSLQQQYMDSTDRSDQNPQRQQLDALDAETMAALRNFTDRINKIKGRPGAGTEQNRAHIKMVQDRVGSVLRSYQELQNKHRKACEEQIARGLRYDNPNITQEAIQEAIDNGVTQPFMYSVTILSELLDSLLTSLRYNKAAVLDRVDLCSMPSMTGIKPSNTLSGKPPKSARCSRI